MVRQQTMAESRTPQEHISDEKVGCETAVAKRQRDSCTTPLAFDKHTNTFAHLQCEQVCGCGFGKKIAVLFGFLPLDKIHDIVYYSIYSD